jgi:hypothetical protein
VLLLVQMHRMMRWNGAAVGVVNPLRSALAHARLLPRGAPMVALSIGQRLPAAAVLAPSVVTSAAPVVSWSALLTRQLQSSAALRNSSNDSAAVTAATAAAMTRPQPPPTTAHPSAPSNVPPLSASIGGAAAAGSEAVAGGGPASGGPHDVLDAIVKVFVTASAPNYLLPWQNKPPKEVTGSGFAISGRRLLTNAHVVADHKFVMVRKLSSPTKYQAKVEAVGHGTQWHMAHRRTSRACSRVHNLMTSPVPLALHCRLCRM